MKNTLIRNYLSFFYFGSAVLGSLVGAYFKFPPLFVLVPLFFFKKPRFALFLTFFIASNLLVIKEVDIKGVQFVGIVKSVQENSCVAKLKYYNGNEWIPLGFDVKIYKRESPGTIIYFIGDLRKSSSYPRYYAKTTVYATSLNYESFTYKIYNSFEEFRKFTNTIDPFYQNIFGNQSRDEFFIKSGLFHIFCVSGMHVSILYLFSSYLVSLITYRKVYRILLSLLFPTIFVIGSGMNIPSIRALTMLFLSAFFQLADYKINAINVVSITGLFMILSNPEIVFSLSFYMTFFATIGVLSASNGLIANVGGFLGSAPYISLIGNVNPFSIVATPIVSWPVQMVMFGLSISYMLFITKLEYLSAFILYLLIPFSWFIQMIAYIFSKLPSVPQHMIISISFALTFIIYLAIMQDTPNIKKS